MDLSAHVLPLAGNLPTTVAACVLLFPLLSFLLLFFFGKQLPRQGDWLALGCTALAFAGSVFLLTQVWGQEAVHQRFTWFHVAGVLPFTAGVYLDNLSVWMLALVTFISGLVQLFSVAYMRGDPHYNRYFAYLGLFTFSMLGIVLADNLLLIFVFWELVGFSSYLLIGFWYERDSASFAAKKAFLVNRIGDVGLLLGLCVVYTTFGTFDLSALRAMVGEAVFGADGLAGSYTLLGTEMALQISPLLLTLGGLGLFGGCVAKSAQFPLLVWLPDAMEGPTPVSSLIHAATMVAAGVFLLSRCYIFFTPDALLVMAIIGGLTAIMGALAACAQFDIKRILAFSTVSQLGYMVLGMGTGNHDAALFHLSTHAFFKAALFLNAGIVIHALHHAMDHHGGPTTNAFRPDPQDIRQMGGIRRALPVTFYSYVLAAAALVGLPLFSGFLSKDAILSGSWVWAQAMSENGSVFYFLLPIMAFLTVLLTGYYIGRHLWLMFMGDFRLPFSVRELRLSDRKEAPTVMLGPVVLLSLLSLSVFFALNPFDFNASWLLQGLRQSVLYPLQNMPSSGLLENLSQTGLANPAITWLTAAGSILLAVAGLAIAWFRYRKWEGASLASQAGGEERAPGLLRVLYHNFYLDRIYAAIVVAPALLLARGTSATDRRFIDYTLDNSGKMTVIFAKIIGWLDRWLVDGLVRLISIVAGALGRVGRGLQSGNMQTYYIFSWLGFVILVLYVLMS